MAERLNTAAELAALRATMEADMRARERERLEAKEQREGMAKDISAIRKEHSAMDQRVIKVEEAVTEMRPVVGSIVSGKAKVAGALIVLGAIGTMVLGFLAYFKSQIAQMIWGA